MTTQAQWDNFVAIAGVDGLWNTLAAKGSSRPPSSYRRELTIDLADRQGGICPVCAKVIEDMQLNHLIHRGSNEKPKGFVPGNVFAGCSACNSKCYRMFGTFKADGSPLTGGNVPLSFLKRPDLIPPEHTPPPILKERAIVRKSSK